MEIKTAIFDMDGTIIEAPYDWPRIKAELQTRGEPILSHIRGLQEPERSRKWKILERYEDTATQHAILKNGIHELLDFLGEHRVTCALVTNNSRKNVAFLLDKFGLRFDHIISREQGLWKPSAAPFQAVMAFFGRKAGECCVIGDSRFDVEAAVAAGIARIFIVGRREESFTEAGAEVYGSLPELQARLAQLLS